MSIFNGNCGGGGGSAVARAHASTHGTGGSDQLTPAMISAAPAVHGHTPAQVGLPNAESTTNKNQPNGYAGLNSSGQVPAALLPSYVDDIVEVANAAALPATGDASVVYVALDTSKAYRWGGSAYVEIAGSPGTTDSVPEGAVNKYFTDARAQAAQVQADWNAASGKSQVLNKPTLGTAAAKDVPATGNASAGQVVLGSDARLTDPRAPTPHTHPVSEVTGLSAALAPLANLPRLARSSAGALREMTGFGPSLFVDMLDASTRTNGVPAGFTMSRPCKRTYFAPDWLVHEAVADVLRHEWEPSTGRYLGALFEGSRQNLLRSSVGMDGPSWHKSSVSGSITPNARMAPDGSGTACLLTDSSTSPDDWYYDQEVDIPNDSSAYAVSVFLCAGSAPKTTVAAYIHNGPKPAPIHVFATVDWATLTTTAGKLTPINNGWWRLTFTISNTSAGYNKLTFRVYPAGQATAATGFVYAWGAQVEKGERASHVVLNYGETSGNLLSFPSTYNVLPWHSIGTLNITSNALAVPGGGFGSLLDDQDSVGDQAYLLQETNVPADTADYTFSVYLHKGNFNGSLLEFNLHALSGLYGSGKYAQMAIDWTTNTATTAGALTVKSSSMTSVGGGWYRLVCTVANNSYGYATMKIYPCQGYTGQRGSVYVYGAQIERGASATSGASAESPAPDWLYRSAAGLYASDRGTMVVEVAAGHGPQDLCNLRTDADNRITIRGDSGQMCVNGTLFSLPVDPTSTVYVLAWHGANLACVTDKTPLQTLNGMMGAPAVNRFVIGSDGQSPDVTAEGGVLMFAYFPARLPDAALNALVG